MYINEFDETERASLSQLQQIKSFYIPNMPCV